MSSRFFSFLLATFITLLCASSLNAQDLDLIRSNIASGNIELQRNALIEIRKLRTAKASRLAVPLLTDHNEILRASAANSVIYLPPQEAASLLLPLLNDKADFVRQEASYALGDVGDASAVNALIRAVQKEKEGVRNAAIVALGKIGDVAAIDVLVETLKKKPDEDNEFMLRAAARSIGQIAQFQRTGIQDLVMRGRSGGIFAWVEKARPAVAILIGVLKDTKQAADTRRQAAFALGAIGDPSAVTVLEKCSSAADPHLAEICKKAVYRFFNNP